jgi:hypothetical protein
MPRSVSNAFTYAIEKQEAENKYLCEKNSKVIVIIEAHRRLMYLKKKKEIITMRYKSCEKYLYNYYKHIIIIGVFGIYVAVALKHDYRDYKLYN